MLIKRLDVSSATGTPYLRHLNHKLKREALVPIDEELERAVANHLACLRQSTGTGPKRYRSFLMQVDEGRVVPRPLGRGVKVAAYAPLSCFRRYALLLLSG